MATAQRFVKDESGMTLALAVIMIVLLGVMGAGLLTYVMKDLNTVAESNRGQRAFEMADAGIQAGKRQLTSDCVGAQSATCSALYGGTGTSPWSAAQGGLTLGDLDADGLGGTADSVHVKISQPSTNHFLVVSTGTYGVATRKIEAMFEGGAGGGGGGGGNVTFPTGWTPSSILVKGPDVHLNAMSLFAGGNIIIDGVTNQTSCTTTTTGRPPRETTTTTCTNPWTNFQNEYDSNGGTIGTISGTADRLADWDSRNLNPSGTWNIVGRKKLDNNGDPILSGNYNQTAYEKSGFAAEGLVCGTTTTTSHIPNCDEDEPADSIADGHYAYDSTTGSKLAWDSNTNSYSKPYGQRVTFQRKSPQDDPNQLSSIISYPFPIEPEPDPVRLKQAALDSDTYYRALDGDTFYKPADPNTLYTWDDLVPNGNNDEVVFIDAQNHDLTYDIGSSRNGIIVAWCGNLQMTSATFQGIVVGMKGDGATLPNDPGGGASTNCAFDDNKGILTTDNSTLKAWLYSNNTSPNTPGIQIGEETTLFFMPNGNFNLLDVLLQDPVMTSINPKGWRELYE